MTRSQNTTTWQELIASKLSPSCQRGQHSWFKGAGDEFISACFPGFFLDKRHRGLQPGEEWHICRECGEAKIVRPPAPPAEPISHIKKVEV